MLQKPKLNLFDFTMIMVSLVIGMGIFRTPANVAATSPNPILFFSIWIAGGIIAIGGALTYAEIGSRFPVTGGYYRIFSYAYHPSIAFAVNCIILISNAASLAGVALIGAEYIIKVVMPTQTDTQAAQITIAIISIVLFYAINLAGLKMSARTQNILTIIKIGLILLLITPLFFYNNNMATATAESTLSNPTLREYIKAFGLGLVAVSFTYGGYQQSINFGEEVKNPAKNIPRGIIIGLLIIISLYLTINYAYYHVIGFTALKTSANIAAIMAGYVFGSAAANILSVLLFLSVLAYVNVLLMANPRVMQAMSDEGMLPSTFGKRTVKTNVLFTSLSVFASLCMLIVFWAKTFDEILSFTIFLDCFGMVLSAATIFKLRKTTQHLNGTGIYQMQLFPLMPIIFMLAYTFVGISIFIDKPITGVTGIAILSGFIALYFAVKKFSKPTNLS
ncbi:APC family permease [Ferruginibacter yonginensis]|uniref:APC family permease n=1 Tax=Ferruginibacter yonginensis TaxID=1310416 RepID=A0ABV8QSX9_9BACT